ncbi:MAG: hypothetical protein KAJ19_29490, partial [Gammaproteobacteria bacterium]|nr:hypothetical protein [Gammaproteobacteria bacterium]
YLDDKKAILTKHQEGGTIFRLEAQTIDGPATELTERLRNELRRHGVRFKSYPKEGEYLQW